MAPWPVRLATGHLPRGIRPCRGAAPGRAGAGAEAGAGAGGGRAGAVRLQSAGGLRSGAEGEADGGGVGTNRWTKERAVRDGGIVGLGWRASV